MAEYIEREAAEKILYDGCHTSNGREGPDDVVELWHMVQAIPAADVQPVRHGRWIKARWSWCTPGGDPVWECSECGKGRHVYGIEHGIYGAGVADGQWVACPNCGAKMDGGEP